MPGPTCGGTALGLRAALRRGAFWSDTSRKGAVCGSRVAQTALFRHVAAREAWDATPPPACGALWKMGQLGKCARATPRQAAGGLRRGLQASAVGPDRMERRSRSVHRLTKMASRCRFRAFVYTVAMRVALGDTSVSTTMGCLRHRWSPASAGHPRHTERRPDVRSMRLSNSFLSACFGCPSRTLPLRCE